MHPNEIVAYFSMEIALRPELPTYSGGLGILAGDTIRSAADLKAPIVAVSLIHRKGYFNQKISSDDWQNEAPSTHPIEQAYGELEQRAIVQIENRSVHIRAWEYIVLGQSGHEIRTLLLDTDLPENTPYDRSLTDELYGGDSCYRLCQEIVLGIGGVRILRALGYKEVARFHMNEGHAALLVLELLDERARWFNRKRFNSDDVEAIRRRCVFTTHTPVPAGHDRFPNDLVAKMLGRNDIFDKQEIFCCDGEVNMTYLALNLSHYVNGVARKHGEVSRQILTPHNGHGNYTIDHITNGVHLATWAAPSLAKLFDKHMPGWREDNAMIRGALALPIAEVEQAHAEAKKALIETIEQRSRANFDPDAFTIGFARRFATYKRANLLLKDRNRLKRIAREIGPLQIVYAGKAHPQDQGGKQMMRDIIQAEQELLPEVKIVFLENYDWNLAKVIIPGVDVWLNTPLPPLEASGTSGMKAALNGVPNLSILDGWWIEGYIENVTGWAIENPSESRLESSNRNDADANSLYQLLEEQVMPTYYKERQRWVNTMRSAISLNASYFNTQRMVQQYVLKAYFE